MALSPPHQPHCGTGISARQRHCRPLARYRKHPGVSADPVAKPAAQTRAESRVLDLRKRLRERDGLSAGGRWIPTLSPERSSRPRTVLALSPQPHCGTGIRPDRDIAARRSDIKHPGVSADAVAKPSAQTRPESRVLDLRKRLRKRDGLSAGGRSIRTIGPRSRKRDSVLAKAKRGRC